MKALAMRFVKWGLWLCLFTILFFCINTNVVAFENRETKVDVFELVFKVPVGDGLNEAVVIPEPHGSTGQGPEAIAVDEQGNIYFVDTIGQKIIVYNGKEVQYFDVSFIDFARDLAVRDGKIFVLDDAGKFLFLILWERLSRS